MEIIAIEYFANVELQSATSRVHTSLQLSFFLIE